MSSTFFPLLLPPIEVLPSDAQVDIDRIRPTFFIPKLENKPQNPIIDGLEFQLSTAAIGRAVKLSLEPTPIVKVNGFHEEEPGIMESKSDLWMAVANGTPSDTLVGIPFSEIWIPLFTFSWFRVISNPGMRYVLRFQIMLDRVLYFLNKVHTYSILYKICESFANIVLSPDPC